MDRVKPTDEVMSLKQLNLMRIMDTRGNSADLLAALTVLLSLYENLAS